MNYPIKFCHISPTKYLSKYSDYNDAHLILAHLVESDPEYADFYANLDDGMYKIMDNSAFEMFKQGRPMYDSSKLIAMGKRCKADCIVMSDYPREDWTKTVEAGDKMLPDIIDAGFQAFFVPQSKLGDFDGYLQGIEWALDQPIKLIGMSILGCPIALGIDEKQSVESRSDTYKLQRFLSRFTVFNTMERLGILKDSRAYKKFHCLGMVDGPNEIDLLKRFSKNIFSWDSSAAIWCGLNGIQFDNSPTGLVNGKFEKEVDFSFKSGDNNKKIIQRNLDYINTKIKE